MTIYPPSRLSAVTLTAFSLLCLATVLTLQSWQNVWRAELWHTDDGSHYVSGAMIAAWISAGFPNPMDFALSYHGHYPIVGIGLWGPAFYVLEAVWFLLSGGSKGAAFLLQSVLAVGLAVSAFGQLSQLSARPVLGGAPSIALALFLLFTHVMLEAVHSIGLDLVVALGLLQATLAFGRYLDGRQWRDLLLFSVLALFTLLVKGNALALYLAIPVTIVAGRNWSVLKDWRLWLVAVLISVPALLWYAATYKLSASGFRHQWGWTFFAHALPGNLRLLADSLSWPVMALAAAGGWQALAGGKDARGRTLQCALGLFTGVMLFQCIVPASLNARYLLSCAAPLLILAGGGLVWVGDRVAAMAPWRLAAGYAPPLAAIAVILMLFHHAVGTVQATEPRTYRGLAGAVDPVFEALPAGNPSVLIVGFDVVETAFIAEVAMRRPFKAQPYVIRGSRLLGGGGYNNFDYQPKFSDVDEVARAIDGMHVAIVVIAPTSKSSSWAHVTQVEQVIQRDSRWQKVWTSDGREDVRVYRHSDNANKPVMNQAIVQLASPKKRASIGQ